MTATANACYDTKTKQLVGISFYGLDASRFPKFVKVNKYGCVSIWFVANDVNKGDNETGVKRVRKIIEILGDELNWEAPALNSYKTLNDFMAAL